MIGAGSKQVPPWRVIALRWLEARAPSFDECLNAIEDARRERVWIDVHAAHFQACTHTICNKQAIQSLLLESAPPLHAPPFELSEQGTCPYRGPLIFTWVRTHAWQPAARLPCGRSSAPACTTSPSAPRRRGDSRQRATECHSWAPPCFVGALHTNRMRQALRPWLRRSLCSKYFRQPLRRVKDKSVLARDSRRKGRAGRALSWCSVCMCSISSANESKAAGRAPAARLCIFEEERPGCSRGGGITDQPWAEHHP